MKHPFRFSATMPPLGDSPRRWRDAVREIEDLGFSSVSVSEHVTRGWRLEPIVAMTAIAETTQRLRVLSLVLANDFRHPVLTHKAAATLDVLSEGRLELGLGTGWFRDDYAALGIPLQSPAIRIARLGEAIYVLKGMFAPGPLTFDGTYYSIHELDGQPKPIQRPHPPLLVGGGGRAILTLGGREADIVGIHALLPDGRLDAETIRDLSFARFQDKVAVVRSAAAAAARPDGAVELQCSVYLTDIPGSSSELGLRSAFAPLLAADPEVAAESPAVLRGSIDHCIEKLEERRERLGLSYINLGSDVRGVAPLVARLTGI